MSAFHSSRDHAYPDFVEWFGIWFAADQRGAASDFAGVQGRSNHFAQTGSFPPHYWPNDSSI